MFRNVHEYYVYILTNMRNGTLYVGMTNNLERRVFEHKNGVLEGFTKKYGLNTLIYFEVHQNVNDAILREKQLKKWKRQWKIDLVEKENPDWNDIARDWYN